MFPPFFFAVYPCLGAEGCIYLPWIVERERRGEEGEGRGAKGEEMQRFV